MVYHTFAQGNQLSAIVHDRCCMVGCSLTHAEYTGSNPQTATCRSMLDTCGLLTAGYCKTTATCVRQPQPTALRPNQGLPLAGHKMHVAPRQDVPSAHNISFTLKSHIFITYHKQHQRLPLRPGALLKTEDLDVPLLTLSAQHSRFHYQIPACCCTVGPMC